MKSFLFKLSGALAVTVLALVFMFSASFAAPPAANAATSTPPRAFFGPGMRGILQEIMQEVSTLEATVSSFAQSFTSSHITTQTLCVADQSGAQTCITKPQLDALLSGGGASPATPQVQISEPTVIISDTSSATTDASSTPPTSPPTDTTTSSTSTDATTSAATSTSQ